MKKNILYIDTRDARKTIVSIKKDEKTFEEILEVEKPRSDVTLEIIHKVLKKSQTELSELHTVQVERGPGSYTGLRIGISIANALSFALKISLNDRPIGELEIPIYS